MFDANSMKERLEAKSGMRFDGTTTVPVKFKQSLDANNLKVEMTST